MKDESEGKKDVEEMGGGKTGWRVVYIHNSRPSTPIIDHDIPEIQNGGSVPEFEIVRRMIPSGERYLKKKQKYSDKNYYYIFHGFFFSLLETKSDSVLMVSPYDIRTTRCVSC